MHAHPSRQQPAEDAHQNAGFPVPAKPSPTKSLAIFTFGFPFFVVRGLFALVRGVARGRRTVGALRAGLAPTIHCPNGHSNPVTGRWECASCKGVYIGWVGRCSVCGAGASWFSCENCGVSIRTPWEG